VKNDEITTIDIKEIPPDSFH